MDLDYLVDMYMHLAEDAYNIRMAGGRALQIRVSESKTPRYCSMLCVSFSLAGTSQLVSVLMLRVHSNADNAVR